MLLIVAKSSIILMFDATSRKNATFSLILSSTYHRRGKNLNRA